MPGGKVRHIERVGSMVVGRGRTSLVARGRIAFTVHRGEMKDSDRALTLDVAEHREDLSSEDAATQRQRDVLADRVDRRD